MEQLNEIGSITYAKLTELPQNTPLLMTDAALIDTKYGKTIVVTVNKHLKVFLPKRFSTVSPEAMALMQHVYFKINRVNDTSIFNFQFFKHNKDEKKASRKTMKRKISDDDENADIDTTVG